MCECCALPSSSSLANTELLELIWLGPMGNTRGCSETQGYTPGDPVDLYLDGVALQPLQPSTPRRAISLSRGTPSYIIPCVRITQHARDLWDWLNLKRECQNLGRGSVRTYGMVWRQQAPAGWHLSRNSESDHGRELLQSGLTVANSLLSLNWCSTIRMWRGLHSIPPCKGQYYDSCIMAWAPSDRSDIDTEVPLQFWAEPGDITEPINCKVLAQDVAHGTDVEWQEICFVQFLSLGEEEADKAIYSNPGVEELAGAGFHRVPRVPMPASPAKDDASTEVGSNHAAATGTTPGTPTPTTGSPTGSFPCRIAPHANSSPTTPTNTVGNYPCCDVAPGATLCASA